MTTSIRSEATRSVVEVNGVDTLSINSDGSVELLVDNASPTDKDVLVAKQVLAVGQTWQDVTASRTLGSTYTNTTGRAIVVQVKATSSATALFGLTFNINGSEAAYSGAYGGSIPFGGTVIVPAGATYSVVGNNIAAMTKWTELR